VFTSQGLHQDFKAFPVATLSQLGQKGRVAQRESVRFTSERSLVRSQPRPPVPTSNLIYRDGPIMRRVQTSGSSSANLEITRKLSSSPLPRPPERWSQDTSPPYARPLQRQCGGLHATANAWLLAFGYLEHRAASCG
jgi:hypothetical protein